MTTVSETIDSTDPREFADDALALRFTNEHGSNLRYTAHWGRWSIWTGNVWRMDQTLAAYDLVRKFCRAETEVCPKGFAVSIASAHTVAAVERLARSDRRHAATVEQWDADPWLLNTPGGIVDLRTGKMRQSRPEEYMTKMTAVAPGGDCLNWRKFLKRITDERQELQDYMQRMCGYALTGITREHALFFEYGTGANGKSVFVNTIRGLMSSYALTAPIETFIESKNDRHPTDLAGLQGARLVTAIETEEGRYWSESKLKAMTGGDPISARFMRQDFFEFAPQFKLFIAGNHKPRLRNVDEAIRRRFNLLPFTVTIPESERDKQLEEKLRAEWPGILSWAIQGCVKWQEHGLRPPAIVTDATEEYLTAEDGLAQWLEDRTERKNGAWESATSLFDDWKAWAELNGEIAGSQKRFSENVEARGFKHSRKSTGRGFEGIAFRTDQ